jgi:hypothetical protein
MVLSTSVLHYFLFMLLVHTWISTVVTLMDLLCAIAFMEVSCISLDLPSTGVRNPESEIITAKS